MYCKSLLAVLCLAFFGMSYMANATPFFFTTVVPTIDKRDLIGLLVGSNVPTPPYSPLAQTLSSIESNSPLRVSSDEIYVTNAVIRPFSPTLTLSISKSNIGPALAVQTDTLVSLTDDSRNLPPSSSSSSPTGWVGDASTTPPAELTEWKVIGIGVITVTLIAILVLLISFFDSWWAFLRSVICGKKSDEGEGEESMVPDRASKGSWELKLADEDGHRYPTLSSMESIYKKEIFL